MELTLTTLSDPGGNGIGDEVILLIRNRLRSIAIGALVALDNRAFSKHQVDFATLLAVNPTEAYNIMVDYFRRPQCARVVLRSLLLAITHNPIEIEEAITNLENGNPSPFLDLIRRARGGKKKHSR